MQKLMGDGDYEREQDSLTIKGCVRVCVTSCPFIISDLNTPSQGSNTDISGVSSKEVTEMRLLQAYFRNSDVLNGFYGIPRSGENYI